VCRAEERSAEAPADDKKTENKNSAAITAREKMVTFNEKSKLLFIIF
jgi:hypothetical protein